MIPSSAFYTNYHGHLLSHLKTLLSKTFPPYIWLAGDSTLDNKYWLHPAAYPPPPQYQFLDPPRCRRDIAYWLTKLAPETHPYTTINCAVEESTLRQRRNALLAQDVFLQENIASDDILVVSAGGNDIALKPTLRIAWAALTAVYFNIGFGPLESLFVSQTKSYIESLISRTKPRLVIVCGLYFMDEAPVASWAGLVLRLLSYNWRPERVQNVQRRIFERMRDIEIEGVQVVTVPLYDALDGKSTEDYVARVEPSDQGGEKIARLLWDVIRDQIAPHTGGNIATK